MQKIRTFFTLLCIATSTIAWGAESGSVSSLTMVAPASRSASRIQDTPERITITEALKLTGIGLTQQLALFRDNQWQAFCNVMESNKTFLDESLNLNSTFFTVYDPRTLQRCVVELTIKTAQRYLDFILQVHLSTLQTMSDTNRTTWLKNKLAETYENIAALLAQTHEHQTEREGRISKNNVPILADPLSAPVQ